MDLTLPTLDTLILHVRRARSGADELQRLDDAIETSADLNGLTEHLVGFFVDEARYAGTSWAEIGQHLGVSRQAVQKRYAAPEVDGVGKRPGVFDRMVPAGKHAIVIAQNEAQYREDHRIATEHVLLGLCGEPETTGARALAQCGANPATITAAINGRIGVRHSEKEKETEKLPFSPAGQRVLQHALREALRQDHDYVGTGHLALACLTVTEGTAAEILTNLGITYDTLRKSIKELSVAEDNAAS